MTLSFKSSVLFYPDNLDLLNHYTPLVSMFWGINDWPKGDPLKINKQVKVVLFVLKTNKKTDFVSFPFWGKPMKVDLIIKNKTQLHELTHTCFLGMNMYNDRPNLCMVDSSIKEVETKFGTSIRIGWGYIIRFYTNKDTYTAVTSYGSALFNGIKNSSSTAELLGFAHLIKKYKEYTSSGLDGDNGVVFMCDNMHVVNLGATNLKQRSTQDDNMHANKLSLMIKEELNEITNPCTMHIKSHMPAIRKVKLTTELQSMQGMNDMCDRLAIMEDNIEPQKNNNTDLI